MRCRGRPTRYSASGRLTRQAAQHRACYRWRCNSAPRRRRFPLVREQSLRKSSSKTTSSKRSLPPAHCLTRCRLVARNAGNTLTSRLLPPPAPARALPVLVLLTLSRLQLSVGMKWMLAQQWIWASGCRWPLSSCKIVTNCLWRRCARRVSCVTRASYPHGYAAVRLLAGDRGESIG